MERYSDCYALYRSLLKNASDDFETERLTNLSAVAVHMANEKESKAKPVEDEDTYELCYNKVWS